MQKREQSSNDEKYPRGWFCLGSSEELAIGDLRSIEAFGTRIVWYRGEDGFARVLDGYCPHMGAELGLGRVDGDGLRCAFHHWKWGSDGSCAEIPYARRIPSGARIKSWPVREIDGITMVWHDPHGRAPDYELPGPILRSHGEWTKWTLRTVDIQAHCRELIDNVADRAHFGPVHRAPVLFFENEFTGHIAVQRSRSQSELLGKLNFLATYYGPGYQIGEYDAYIGGEVVKARMLNTHLPINENSFRLFFGVMVMKGKDGDASPFIDEYTDMSLESFMQDVRIWQNKRYEPRPLLCEGDGQINQLREWYGQFYHPSSVTSYEALA